MQSLWTRCVVLNRVGRNHPLFHCLQLTTCHVHLHLSQMCSTVRDIRSTVLERVERWDLMGCGIVLCEWLGGCAGPISVVRWEVLRSKRGDVWWIFFVPFRTLVCLLSCDWRAFVWHKSQISLKRKSGLIRPKTDKVFFFMYKYILALVFIILVSLGKERVSLL